TPTCRNCNSRKNTRSWERWGRRFDRSKIRSLPKSARRRKSNRLPQWRWMKLGPISGKQMPRPISPNRKLSASARCTAADSLQLAANKLEQQRLTDAEDRLPHLEGLKSEVNRLRGVEATTRASIKR